MREEMQLSPQEPTVKTLEVRQGVPSPTPVMLSLLGTFKLTLDGNLAPISNGSKTETLLIMLTLRRPRRLYRAILLEHLWPDYDPTLAGQSLNSLTYQVNKLVKGFIPHLSLVTHSNGYYYLNTSPDVGTDFDYFERWSAAGKRLLQQGNVERGIAYCERAVALYRGDLCADFDIQMVIEQERLRITFLDLLVTLAGYYVSRDPAKSLTYIHRLLQHDPCREDAHRLAMRCYVQLNIRAQALRQYRLCCKILAAEFDAEPEPATVVLYNQIRLNSESLQP